MKKDISLTSAINEISQVKDIDKDLIIQTLEKTIVDAAKKKYPQYSNIEAQFDESEDSIRLYYYKTVAKKVLDENNEIAIEKAQEVDSESQLEDEISYEIEEEDYSNTIAQTARQGFFQKINELENSLLIEQYTEQIGKIVHGTVGQVNKNRSLIILTKNINAILDTRDAIPFEKLTSGDVVKSLLKEIDERDPKKKYLKLSRTHPDFLLKLLELEVPEVDDKTIEVVAVARDPGKRAKIAVKTNNSDIDPVGSCVGRGGERIQTVVNELNGERIDVIPWSEDFKQFIVDALVPAEIDHIELNTENNIADVFINDKNLALAIGKRGQNVRLASQLTQFELNIRMLEETKSEPEETTDAGKEAAVPDIDLFGADSPPKIEETTKEKITASDDASKSTSPIKKTVEKKITASDDASKSTSPIKETVEKKITASDDASKSTSPIKKTVEKKITASDDVSKSTSPIKKTVEKKITASDDASKSTSPIKETVEKKITASDDASKSTSPIKETVEKKITASDDASKSTSPIKETVEKKITASDDVDKVADVQSKKNTDSQESKEDSFVESKVQ